MVPPNDVRQIAMAKTSTARPGTSAALVAYVLEALVIVVSSRSLSTKCGRDRSW